MSTESRHQILREHLIASHPKVASSDPNVKLLQQAFPDLHCLGVSADPKLGRKTVLLAETGSASAEIAKGVVVVVKHATMHFELSSHRAAVRAVARAKAANDDVAMHCASVPLIYFAHGDDLGMQWFDGLVSRNPIG